MPNETSSTGRQQKPDKDPAEPMRSPMRAPAGEDEAKRNGGIQSDFDFGVAEEEEFELDLDDIEMEDSEGNQITGRHPSQRDRDLT